MLTADIPISNLETTFIAPDGKKYSVPPASEEMKKIEAEMWESLQQTKANEKQIAGEHYKIKRVQPWDVIDTFDHAQAIGFYRGNCVKYLMRAGTKKDNPAKQDYQKALHYLEKLLEIL